MASVMTPHATLQALRQMAQALSAAWGLDPTLDLIARKTAAVMAVDSCSIYLLDPDGQALRLRATTGLARRALGRSTLRLGEGLTGRAVALNQPVHAADAQGSPYFKRVNEADEDAFHSLLAVPLTIETRPIGAMNVQTRSRHEFDPSEIELLALIGDLAAGALARARLHDRQKRQIEELRALAEVSEAVTSPQYLDEILDIVTGLAAETMNAALCSVFLINEAGTHLELRSAQRATLPYRHRPPHPLGEGVIGQVAVSGRTQYIVDVRVHPGYLGSELARNDGLVSLLSVPLRVRDSVIGVFNCYTGAVHQFTPAQRRWFGTLANQTALAIDNARLVTNAAVIREMHHRIKNNLQTVAMLMQLQLAEADGLTAQEVLQANIHRVHSIATVHESLSEQGFRLVDVRDVLGRITRMTAETMTRPSLQLAIEIEGESLLLPSRAATALTLVVNELVHNAIEHGLSGREAGQIVVSLGRSAEEIIVLVRDNGRGLPVELQAGLGLEIVETLVRDDLRGRIKYHRLPAGTEISLRLPRTLEEERE